MLLDHTLGQPVGHALAFTLITVHRPTLAALGIDDPARITRCHEDRVLDGKHERRTGLERRVDIGEQPR
ncbi:hypothetical protein FQZ97_1075990 [compost metagenome]